MFYVCVYVIKNLHIDNIDKEDFFSIFIYYAGKKFLTLCECVIFDRIIFDNR